LPLTPFLEFAWLLQNVSVFKESEMNSTTI
jgi:hypothetical protein